MDGEKALKDLLDELFTSAQLRRFLEDDLDTRAILKELPGESAPHAELVSKTVGELRRRGLVDGAFFARLLARFPKRKADIEAASVVWLSPKTKPPPRSSPGSEGLTEKGTSGSTPGPKSTSAAPSPSAQFVGAAIKVGAILGGAYLVDQAVKSSARQKRWKYLLGDAPTSRLRTILRDLDLEDPLDPTEVVDAVVEEVELSPILVKLAFLRDGLVEFCQEHALPTQGTKDELAQRVFDYIESSSN